jgi:5-methylcytosine-specific restriction endonuclease McrA
MAVVVIIVIILLSPFVFNWYSNYQQKKEAEFRRTKLTPIVEQAYIQLTEKVRREYPLIPFVFPPVLYLMDQYDSYDITIPPRPHVQQILRPLVDFAVKSFQDYSCVFPNSASSNTQISTSQNTIIDVDFWKSEIKHRTTKHGTLPVDWTIRRQIIHKRDNKKCRRCGIEVELSDCHIHHIIRKSKGGMHSFENLVTLCRDCHALMPEHDDMKTDMYYKSVGTRVYYFLSKNGTIHKDGCQHVNKSKRVSDLYSRLIERGYKPCHKCNPDKLYLTGSRMWTPEISKFIEEQISYFYD